MRPFLSVFQDYCIMANIGLKGIDMLILAQIESLNKDGCKCYMTNEGFSKKFGDSESTIKRSLDKLESLKLIKRKTITNIKGGHASKQRLIIIDEAGFKVALAQALTKVHNDPSLVEYDIESKVHNDPSLDEKLGSNITKLGSNVDEARFKNDLSKVHNDPIEYKLEEPFIRKKEGLFDPADAGSQSPATANADPPAAQPLHNFSFNDKLIIRMKLKPGVKKSEVVRDLKNNDNINLTIEDLNQIWDEYKGSDGLRKLKELADKEEADLKSQQKQDKALQRKLTHLDELMSALDNRGVMATDDEVIAKCKEFYYSNRPDKYKWSCKDLIEIVNNQHSKINDTFDSVVKEFVEIKNNYV